jgi:hypothetical protein
MITFTVQSARIGFECFYNPRFHPDPILTTSIRITFDESSDPDNPNEDRNAFSEIDSIPIPFIQSGNLSGVYIDIVEIADNEDLDEFVEGGIYYYGYHNPVDLELVSIRSFADGQADMTLKGHIDFTYEGLSHLGKPAFEWSILASYDIDEFNTEAAKFRSLTKGLKNM